MMMRLLSRSSVAVGLSRRSIEVIVGGWILNVDSARRGF
jgi:hypothetical protein